MYQLACLLACVAVAAARKSPNADDLEGLLKSQQGFKISEVSEDAYIDVPGVISKHGYPVEIHNVVTSDGYILELHRIPHGRGSMPGARPAVLLMHGLLSSSADFIIMGPELALGYILADAGYDVWLGNARGNYYSRRHTSLNPDSFLNKNFWRFSWDEIGNYDLPAFIDFILITTGERRLHYVGHSQGGTSFLVLSSLRPEYNAKIISFQGLAPACFFKHNDHSLFNTLANFESILESTAFTMGFHEIFGGRQISTHCAPGSLFYNSCQNALHNLMSREYYNATMIPVIFGHTPAGAAIRQVAHYGQVIRFNEFRRYNHNTITNLAIYGSRNPPLYDLSLVTVPTYLHYGLSDRQVDYRDLLDLAAVLPNVQNVHKADRDTFDHFDFLWALDAKEQVYDEVLVAMQHAENIISVMEPRN